MPNNEAERDKLKALKHQANMDWSRLNSQVVGAEQVPPTESGEVPYSPNHAIYIGNLKKRIVEVEDANETLHGIAARRVAENQDLKKQIEELEKEVTNNTGRWIQSEQELSTLRQLLKEKGIKCEE